MLTRTMCITLITAAAGEDSYSFYITTEDDEASYYAYSGGSYSNDYAYTRSEESTIGYYVYYETAFNNSVEVTDNDDNGVLGSIDSDTFVDLSGTTQTIVEVLQLTQTTTSDDETTTTYTISIGVDGEQADADEVFVSAVFTSSDDSVELTLLASEAESTYWNSTTTYSWSVDESILVVADNIDGYEFAMEINLV